MIMTSYYLAKYVTYKGDVSILNFYKRITKRISGLRKSSNFCISKSKLFLVFNINYSTFSKKKGPFYTNIESFLTGS